MSNETTSKNGKIPAVNLGKIYKNGKIPEFMLTTGKTPFITMLVKHKQNQKRTSKEIWKKQKGSNKCRRLRRIYRGANKKGKRKY